MNFHLSVVKIVKLIMIIDRRAWMQCENEHVECKSQLAEGICKEIIAFANSDGGVVYIGVDDQGKPLGVEDVDITYTRLTNMVRDAIQPDVTMFVRYSPQRTM